MDINDFRDAALGYAAHGLFVIPAHYAYRTENGVFCSCGVQHGPGKNGKHPAVAWTRYQTHRPTTGDIRYWFGVKYKLYNICAVHGAMSGTILLDWDGIEGYASQRALEAILGPLPDTPTVLSGGGGSHQLYRHPGVHVPTNKGLRPNFDVRGDGGISILPPSSHEFGDYVWECDRGIDDVPLADLPEAWIKFITTSASSTINVEHAPDEPVVWKKANNGRKLVTDGREVFMRDVVWNAFIKLRRTGNPTAAEIYALALPEYLAFVDQSKPGRGRGEVWEKCQALVRKYRNREP